MKVLSDSMQGDVVRRGGPDRVQQQQVQVIFHVLSLLLAAQYSCTKGLGADSAASNAICNPQVRAAMQQGVQLLISALDHHHSIDGHHIADQRVMHFNKDSEGRRLVGLCSLMLQVRTVGWMLPSTTCNGFSYARILYRATRWKLILYRAAASWLQTGGGSTTTASTCAAPCY
jgi:hypothetical protein